MCGNELVVFPDIIILQWQSYIYKIIVVRLSVTEGQQKWFDPKTQEAVYLAMERKKPRLDDLCEQQSWH